ncbi:MAG: DNA-3-methyladenine glycosylase I [Thermomicrobiales bacterium]|nr:DNA-3-methyladenine glycosylase I [Thermomicrobiales bacterium]MCO5221744.1 DNA-3-methyladenine glycosylase I [Thermomicrobiales bacterium]
MSEVVGIGIDGRPKCFWCLGTATYEAYHDEEWGEPIRDDKDLFAKLMLDGFQAGLSWSTILHKRENFDRAFDGWDPETIARYTQDDVDRLMADAGIVRNRLKVNGAVKNARAYLQLVEEEGAFSDYLWSFVGGDTIVMRPVGPEDFRATSPESDAMSKALKQRGFTFVGSTICYAFMQAVGMIDDHVVGCWRAQ